MLQELVTLMLGNKYKTGLCPCTCWWLRRHLRKTCRFFSFSEIRLLNSGVMPCVLKQRHADWILTVQSNTRHTHGQLLMPVHQLWMLLPVKALCVGELVAYISFLEHKVQKQAPASLNFLHQLPKGLLSFPSHLFYPCPAPFIFMNLLSILLSFGVMSLYSGIYARQSDREKSVFEAHFPKTRPNLLLIG